MLMDLWSGMIANEGAFAARHDEIGVAIGFVNDYYPNLPFTISITKSHTKFTVAPRAKKPTAVVLIYKAGLLNDTPFLARVTYNDKELQELVRKWTDGEHRVNWMPLDFSTEQTLPVDLVRDIFAAFEEGYVTLPPNYELKAGTFDEAVIEVIEHNPEPEVAKWLISELKKFQKKEICCNGQDAAQ
jgi:hypothetical protein